VYLHLLSSVFVLLRRHPSSPTLFPYTTLFRSWLAAVPKVWGMILMFVNPVVSSMRLSSFLVMNELVDSWSHAYSSFFLTMMPPRSEEHTSELQSRFDIVCRLLLEKKNK